jgi:hypothetical protein
MRHLVIPAPLRIRALLLVLVVGGLAGASVAQAAHQAPAGSGEAALIAPSPAGVPAAPPAGSSIAGEALIILNPEETGNYKLANLLVMAQRVNSAGPDGFVVPAQTTFSFLRSGLLDGPYVPGWDTAHHLVQGGGLCAGSTMLATLVAAAQAQGAPVAITRRVLHNVYEPAYHQVNRVNGRLVPVVDAAVTDGPGAPQDLRWANDDTAAYAARFMLLTDPGDGSRIPLDEARAWAEYRAAPYAPIARPVYFYGRLTRLP